MIAAFILAALLSELPIEPTTRAELDAVSQRFSSASVKTQLDAGGRLKCGSGEPIGSAELSIQLCLLASNCLERGVTGSEAVQGCVDRQKGDLLEEYRSDWLEAHSQ